MEKTCYKTFAPYLFSFNVNEGGSPEEEANCEGLSSTGQREGVEQMENLVT